MPHIRHALEGSSSGAAVAVHGRDQKPKALPCKYCNKRFRSVGAPSLIYYLLLLSRLLTAQTVLQTCGACAETQEDAHQGEALFVCLGPLWQNVWTPVSLPEPRPPISVGSHPSDLYTTNALLAT